jgi:Fe-S-cluster containining protein
MSDPLADRAAGAPVRLRAPPPAGEASISGRISLRVSGEVVDFELEAPDGPAKLRTLLPIFQGFTDELVSRGVAKAVGEGRSISCRAGCGACCRQPVPVSEPEAHALAAVVAAMPEPRQAEVRARFAAIERRLEETGLAEGMETWLDGDNATVREKGMAYFRLGMPCPFLEAESCSIYPDRPLICREYVVTSPVSACDMPSPETIDRIDLAGRPSRALLTVGKAATSGGWLLLTQALSFAERHAEPAADQPAPAQIQAVFACIAGEVEPGSAEAAKPGA